MKISTKGRYALIFMLDLLEHTGTGLVSIKDISRRQDVSEKYLEQIVCFLLRSGMIQSVRGSGGGYLLKRGGDKYTVGEILRVTEGDLAIAPCVEENGCGCKRKNKCKNVMLWEKIDKAVHSVIDNITLSDMSKWETEVTLEESENHK